MSRTRRRRSANRRWYLPAAILAAVVLIAAAWLLPRRVHDVVSFDQRHRWDQDSAPPQSRIVWEPAAAIPAAAEDAALEDSLVRPQLADGGATLYFTLQRADGSADIYSSVRQGERWSAGAPVADLNSPADDFGPVLSADGRELYLYSDRPGGQGGFDLYVCRRTADGWSTPENLGPEINTPAHEYDPAISPDGEHLYFSSNRTRSMQRRADASARDAGADADGEDRTWRATLRAEPGLRQFDLYAAQRGSRRDRWRDVEPLEALNTATADEGEPFVSPNGALLYFASNRANGRDDAPNYDIYRARLRDGKVVSVENLGSGVNTAANEHDPALSPEGFRIFFSSDRADAESGDPAPVNRYALYASQATEVYNEGGWDASHWSVLADNLWWIVTALLVAALLAALAWYIRQVSLRRAPVPIFFLIALLLHLLLAPALFVPLGGATIAERIKTQIDKIVATDVQLESPSTHSERRNAYESVAELAAAETAQVSQAAERSDDPPRVVLATESVAMTVPRRLNPRMPAENEVAAAVRQTPMETSEPTLPRRRRALAELLARDKIELETAKAPEQPIEVAAVETLQVDVERESPAEDENAAAAAMEPAAESSSGAPSRVRPIPLDAARPGMGAPPSVNDLPNESSLPRRERLAVVDRQAGLHISIPTDPPVADDRAGLAAAAPSVEVQIDRSAEGAPTIDARAPRTTASAGEISSTIEPDAGAPAQAAASPAPPTNDLHLAFDPPRRTSRPQFDLAGVDPPILPANADVETLADAGGLQALRDDVRVGKSADEDGKLADSFDFHASQSPGDTGDRLAAAEKPSRQPLGGVQTVGIAEKTPFNLSRGKRAVAPAMFAGKANLAAIENAGGQIDGQVLSEIDGERLAVDRTGSAADVDAKLSQLPGLAAAYEARGPRPSVDALAKVEFGAAVAPNSPIDSPLARRAGRVPLLLYAQDKIGLQSMLRLRVGDDATKEDLIEAFGGDRRTLPAIRRGLAWLARVQHDDGHWDLKEFANPPKGQKYTGQGRSKSDSAATGLALLPFLGDGHTHLAGKYQTTVEKGLRWLIDHQADDGKLFTGGEGNAHMYSHGIAAIALCEAYGMTEDEALRQPAQRAVEYIVKAQHNEGGWRYRPGDKGDTSVVGWQIMALKSAQMADLDVPQATLDKARKYIERVRRGNGGAEFGYQRGSHSAPAMTAEGLLCYEYLGAKAGDAKLMRTVDWLAGRTPQTGKDTSYYWYYGTQALFHVQGEPWRRWVAALDEAVLPQQIKDGPDRGTWDPRDRWEASGGRIMSTSLRLLMLEVHFRHLPLFQALE